MSGPFSPEERDRLRAIVLERARTDRRIVAAATVGSFATGKADRWSDLDLAFALADGVMPDAVLDDWTGWLRDAERATHLFDLPAGSATYRVLLLPNALQLDVSIWPTQDFHSGPGFELVFGAAAEPKPPSTPPTGDLFGWAVVYAIHARACIERGRLWQADYDLNALRERALAVACIGRGLKWSYGRAFDDLPSELLAAAARTRAASVAVSELSAATARAIELLLSEGADLDPRAAALEADLRAVARWLEERSSDPDTRPAERGLA